MYKCSSEYLDDSIEFEMPSINKNVERKAPHDTCHPHEAIQVALDQGQDQKRALDGLQKVY